MSVYLFRNKSFDEISMPSAASVGSVAKFNATMHWIRFIEVFCCFLRVSGIYLSTSITLLCGTAARLFFTIHAKHSHSQSTVVVYPFYVSTHLFGHSTQLFIWYYPTCQNSSNFKLAIDFTCFNPTKRQTYRPAYLINWNKHKQRAMYNLAILSRDTE